MSDKMTNKQIIDTIALDMDTIGIIIKNMVNDMNKILTIEYRIKELALKIE